MQYSTLIYRATCKSSNHHHRRRRRRRRHHQAEVCVYKYYRAADITHVHSNSHNKKLSYCWETVRRESMPRIAEIDVEMIT